MIVTPSELAQILAATAAALAFVLACYFINPEA